MPVVIGCGGARFSFFEALRVGLGGLRARRAMSRQGSRTGAEDPRGRAAAFGAAHTPLQWNR
jgi:hypothetical protein